MLDRPTMTISMMWMASAVAMASPAWAQEPAPAPAPAPAAARVPATASRPADRPPTLTGPRQITVPAGGSLTTWYTVADDLTPPAALDLTVQVPDRELLPEGSVRLEGEGSRRALTIAPPPGPAGSTTLEISVADSAGLSESAAVVVNVRGADATGPVPIPPAPPILLPAAGGSMTSPRATGRSAWPCGCGGVMASGQSLGGGATATAATARPTGPVVSRAALVRGRTAADGPALFDAAYQHYWAGSYAQAAEAAAASAALWDDPRAWEYLAMAEQAMGDEAAAAPAARYAAAKVLAEPTYEQDLARSLTRLQGLPRRRIEAMQTGILDRRAALEVMAARPDPLNGMAPVGAPSPAPVR